MARRRRHGEALRRLQAQWHRLHERRLARLRHAAATLRNQHPQRQLLQAQQRLQPLPVRAAKAMETRLQHDRLRLQALARSLSTVSPLATVARGYAIVTRRDDGDLLRRIDQVTPGDAVQARVGDGVIDMQVTGTTPSAEGREG